MFNLGTFLTIYVEYRALSIVDNYKSEIHGESFSTRLVKFIYSTFLFAEIGIKSTFSIANQYKTQNFTTLFTMTFTYTFTLDIWCHFNGHQHFTT